MDEIQLNGKEQYDSSVFIELLDIFLKHAVSHPVRCLVSEMCILFEGTSLTENMIVHMQMYFEAKGVILTMETDPEEFVLMPKE